MGQNTFPILLLNDDNMIGEHQKTRMKMLYGCPFEKNEKEVFFRLTTFFFRNKNFFFREQLQFSFLCITMQKKISERSENFRKFLFSKIANFFFKKNFFGSLRIFFLHALYYMMHQSVEVSSLQILHVASFAWACAGLQRQHFMKIIK